MSNRLPGRVVLLAAAALLLTACNETGSGPPTSVQHTVGEPSAA